MNIRISLRAALALASLLSSTITPCRADAADAGQSQYFELRIYTTRSAAQQRRINDYWQSAAVPACNRLGVQPIGIFTDLEDSETNRIYVLLPYDSAEAFASIPGKLAADAAYQGAAAGFLNAPKSDPAYERFETFLLVAFDGMRRMALPPPDKRPNVFELRTYLSPSENKSLNKKQMFESGEITVMKEVGLAPIFYGRTLAGPQMPCLVYMTCGENLAEHKKHWQAFSAAPVWKKLQADPRFKDNMSGSIKLLLKRTSASQI